MDCGLITKKGMGLTAKSEGIFQREIFFQKENTMDSVHHPWTVGGASPWWTMDKASAMTHQSSAWQPLQATVACCQGGIAKRVTRRNRGTAHQSLDDGEEVVHQWWNFGSKW
jgi:hypothetical protein